MEMIKKDVVQTKEIQNPTNGLQKNSVRDLRYILTQKCNYNCVFCHKEGCDGTEKALLKPNDYTFLFSTARESLGIQKTTLSGGEPLIRKDIKEIAKELHKVCSDITIVTNGALFQKKAEVAAYLKNVNLSLHTTNQQLYSELTRGKTNVDDIISGVKKIQEQYPHLNIKLNSAIIRDENTTDSADFERKMKLAQRYGRKLKYLELCDPNDPLFVDIKFFEKELLKKGFTKTNNTARQHNYQKDNIEIITGRVFCSEAKTKKDPEGYCKQHNDIYVTPDGYMSACPIDIKKIFGYTAIVKRDHAQLKELLLQITDPKTHYQCPFTSGSTAPC